MSFMGDLTQNRAEEYWRGIAVKSRANKSIVFGAFIDDLLMGTATLVIDSPPNHPHRAEVAKVLVRPKFQHRGIARALMRKVETKALEIGRISWSWTHSRVRVPKHSMRA
jgi:GNAT superfamily N-acetyltransferase